MPWNKPKEIQLDLRDAEPGATESRQTVADAPIADVSSRDAAAISPPAAKHSRNDAFNIMLSMPAGTDALALRHAAREFAKAQLANHRYVMVQHTHQANPHVHISVRAEGRDGSRLNPRKEDFPVRKYPWPVKTAPTPPSAPGSKCASPWRRKACSSGRRRFPAAR